jgi:hypothetical protein
MKFRRTPFAQNNSGNLSNKSCGRIRDLSVESFSVTQSETVGKNKIPRSRKMYLLDRNKQAPSAERLSEAPWPTTPKIFHSPTQNRGKCESLKALTRFRSENDAFPLKMKMWSKIVSHFISKVFVVWGCVKRHTEVLSQTEIPFLGVVAFSTQKDVLQHSQSEPIHRSANSKTNFSRS